MLYTEHEQVEMAYGASYSYAPKQQYGYDPRSYIFIIDQFVQSGELPPGVVSGDGMLSFDASDPMMVYIIKTISDSNIQARVLSSKVMALAFRDMMAEFIIQMCEKMKYMYSRASGEQNQAEQTKSWSFMKRQKGTEALLSQIDDEHRKDGFDKDFYEQFLSKQGYEDEDKWEKMCNDWKQSIKNGLRKKTEEAMKARANSLQKSMIKHLDRVKMQADEMGASDYEAIQAWKMMNGQWTESQFEKMMNIVHIQNKYPEIAEVCRKMGRVVNEQDSDLMKVATGNKFKVEHSSGSDIEGITMGNDFNALLPNEIVHFSDNDLENVFYQRFVTKKLQMFRYKSEMAKPSRKLNWQHASRKGPMIACVDSSASMNGVPQKIAASLLGRLETTAEMLNRDCFLIDFSVDIKPVDLRKRVHEYRLNALGLRSVEYDFTKGLFPFLNGGTNATKMLEKTFELLESNPVYMNADILWITDFLIPLPDKSLLAKMQQYRKEGTHFYGFQIGIEPHQWSRFFDKIYQVQYRIPRRF